jgi:hypothetical protein
MYWKYSRTAVVNRTAVLAVEVDWLKSIKANLVVRSLPKHARLMADQFDEVREGVVISLQVSMLVRVVENCELLDLYPSRRKLFERSSFYPKQVSDIVPIACQAAAQAGIPSVCISNFRYIISFRLHIYHHAMFTIQCWSSHFWCNCFNAILWCLAMDVTCE